jgi:hypothetical protein
MWRRSQFTVQLKDSKVAFTYETFTALPKHSFNITYITYVNDLPSRLRRKNSEYSMSRGDVSLSNTADENNREKLRQILCNLRKDPMDEDLVTFGSVFN